MAYFDHAQAAYENRCKEEYEKLKESLRKSTNEDDEMLATHINKLEFESRKAKDKVERYEEFFKMLQSLLPRQSSIHDVIG